MDRHGGEGQKDLDASCSLFRLRMIRCKDCSQLWRERREGGGEWAGKVSRQSLCTSTPPPCAWAWCTPAAYHWWLPTSIIILSPILSLCPLASLQGRHLSPYNPPWCRPVWKHFSQDSILLSLKVIPNVNKLYKSLSVFHRISFKFYMKGSWVLTCSSYNPQSVIVFFAL